MNGIICGAVPTLHVGAIADIIALCESNASAYAPELGTLIAGSESSIEPSPAAPYVSPPPRALSRKLSLSLVQSQCPLPPKPQTLLVVPR
mmetsp:Transcript_12085/g.39763  ORF Transcript_12085/g.39763 Transcript_12085/m.39763 type:complete len:90 (-) Transcript_12085:95-364(-)